MPNRCPYLSVSASGNYDDRAKELFSDRPLRVGTPYALAAVYEPGKRMALYINGFAAGELTRDVPERVHKSPAPASR